MDYGGRLLNCRPGLRVAVWSWAKVCGRRLSLRPIGWTPALSETQKRRCSCAMKVLYAFVVVERSANHVSIRRHI